MGILIHRDGQEYGPFEIDALQASIEAGELVPDDYAWQEGCDGWVRLSDLIDFEAVAAPAALPTTTPPPMPASTMANIVENQAAKVESAVARYLTEEQDPSAVHRIVQKAQSLLTRGELIDYIAVQKKPIITISPDAVVLTNRRFMIVRPKLLGMTFQDFLWRQVADVHLSEQMLSATIHCTIVDGQKLEIDSIPKVQARRIYAYAQDVEERMHVERRDREMEERRASAGGVVIHSPPAAVTTQAVDDPVNMLSKLKQMLDAGLIEKSEFDAKKAEVLARM